MIKKQGIGNGIPISTSLQATLQNEQMDNSRSLALRRVVYISALAIVIASLMAFIAKFLVLLIGLFTNLAFFGQWSFATTSPQHNTLGLLVLLPPVIGGIIVGCMALWGSRAIRGHGIPEAMEQVLTNDSKIKPALTYLKPVSSAIAIGTGGPFGAEGPIIATGGALGSTIGQLLRISHNERKVLLAAGATAGMSAIFGSPVAAVFLAIELLLFEFSAASIIPVSLACITGAAGHLLFFGRGPVFAIQVQLVQVSGVALFMYSMLGLLFGLLSVGATMLVYYLEDLFEKLPIHWMWWPAIGGLFVGTIGYFEPRTLGVGYNNITDILSGSLTLQFIGTLCVLKFCSWAISLSSGTSGGTLAPLLTIGGAAGGFAGICIQQLFPAAGISISLAALVGMSAMFAGASRALLTSVIFALETTGQVNALLPLLAACTISYFVSLYLMKNTIMTEKIARRGVITPESYKPDLLEQFNVAQVMNNDGLIISGENNIADLREWLAEHTIQAANYFIIVDEQGLFNGIISSSNLFSAQHDPAKKVNELLKRKAVCSRPADKLKIAMELMMAENLDVLPVVNADQVVAGIISYTDIMNIYKLAFTKQHKGRPHISLKRQTLKLLLKGQKLVTINREY